MSRSKKHHYVPVFYLRPWRRPNGKLVYYMRSPRGKVIKREITPENTGYEKELYSFEGLTEDQIASIEERFMGPAVDGPASKAIRKLLESGIENLTIKERCDFTRFLISLMLRVPEVVYKIRTDGPRVLRDSLNRNPEDYQSARTKNDPETLTEWVEQNNPALIPNYGMKILPELIDDPQFTTPIMNMQWWLIDVSQASNELLTSDRPLLMLGGKQKSQWAFFLAVNPKTLFVAARNRQAIEVQIDQVGLSFFVKKLNESIVAQAHQRVYSSSLAHKLTFFETRLGRNWLTIPYAKDYAHIRQPKKP